MFLHDVLVAWSSEKAYNDVGLLIGVLEEVRHFYIRLLSQLLIYLVHCLINLKQC